jgi:VanZ family protein
MTQGTRKLLGAKSLKFIGITYSLFITFLLLFPTTNIPKVEVPYIDKLGHVTLFAILIIIWLFFVLSKTGWDRLISLWVVLIIFFYGIIIEALQGMFFESRTADGWDIIANSAGILLGWLIFQKIKKLFLLKN